MPTQVQWRRGTTTQNNSFTGAEGELSVDTTLDTLRVHDGSTAGGHRLFKWSEALGLGSLSDPNDDSILFWDDSAGALAWMTEGTGLTISGTSIALSHLGIESLSDPNADRIAFWDDSAGALQWLTIGSNLTLSGTTLSADYDGDITGVTAGDGLSGGGTSGGVTLALDLNELTAATVDVANDSIAIIDAGDSSSKKEAISDLVSGIAGTGLSESSGQLVVGTLNQDTTGNAATSDLATSVTASANNSTDETVYPTFVDGATGTQGIETDTGLTYNPSDGNLTSTTFTGNLTGNVTGNASGTAATVTGAAQTNITSLGTLTALTVDNVVIDGAVIGHTGDTDLITLSSGVVTVAGEVDATSLDVSGDADIDGTLEADAITVGGSTLESVVEGFFSATDAGGDGSFSYSNGVYTYTGPSAAEVRAHITAGTGVAISSGEVSIGQAVATTSDVTFADLAATGNVTITGNLDVNGTTTTLDTTNSTIADRLIELGNGTTGTPANDMGIVLERGSSDNVLIGWDESTDNVVVGTGSFTGASTGDLTYTAANFTAGVGTFSSLDISGNADIDGTLEADAYTVDGTALNEYIQDTVGGMVGSNTETGITVSYEDGDGTLDFVVGTLNQDTTGNAATADLATLATSITATANNTTDETVYLTFVDGATGTQGIETDTGLTYNPSSGALSVENADAGSSAGPELTLYRNSASPADADYIGQIKFSGEDDGGATTVYSKITGKIGDVTNSTEDGIIEFAAQKAGTQTILARLKSDKLELINSTALDVDGAVTAASLDISGSADIDGTMEADAYTVDGTALNEYIADTVGAMITSNTETRIAVTYDDSDNTLDFVVDDMTANTTYSAGTGLNLSSTTFSLSHLGIESLSDPNADKFLIWDDSAGATAFATLGDGLSASGTTINGVAIYDSSGSKLN